MQQDVRLVGENVDTHLRFSLTGIRAILFDLDGTLFETFTIHWNAYRDALRQLDSKHDISWQDFFAINIKAGNKFDCNLDVPSEILYRAKTECFEAAVKENLHPAAGVIDLISGLCASGGKFAIVTSARQATVDVLLNHCWPLPVPNVIITSTNVARPKPAPDAYLAAAKALRYDVSLCVGVEDSPAGAQAVISAGMACIVKHSPYFDASDFPSAVHVVDSFANLRVESE